MSQPADKTDVHYFWPEQRIQALRMYARDESEPADKFVLSKRLAWMREFCIDAPSWLQTMEMRERLRNKVQAAFNASAAATAQLENLLADIDAMGAPPAQDVQDRWAASVTSNVQPLPAKKPSKVMAEAPDNVPDPQKPKGEPKKPEAGQKLPSEQLWDLAHGKKPMGPSSLKAKIERLAPDAKARIVGKPLQPAAAQPKEAAKEQAEPKSGPKSEPKPLAKQAEADAPAKPATGPKMVRVRMPDGTEKLRAPRTGFRMALDEVSAAHGDEVATFVAHVILQDAVNVAGIRRVMGKFCGTFHDRLAASVSCARIMGKLDEWNAGEDVLRTQAAYFLEHENGQVSWWAK